MKEKPMKEKDEKMSKVVNLKTNESQDDCAFEMVRAGDIFRIEKKNKSFDFEIPYFTDTTNEHIPSIDEKYQFREKDLLPLLWALKTNQNSWLSGHTGTGKSTLVKQVCARLNWPMLRVNFDSEISRMDLVGRDVLTTDENGNTVSQFVDGILPTAISDRYVLLCDEVDFIRPDVAYVMQRALEDEGLLISEDGGRIVTPHKWSRMVATGNTQGQGDDFGIYQGARAQSMAFLDRFTVWIECEYLSETQEKQLIKETVPEVDEHTLKQIIDYVREHRAAFDKQEVSQPISPRSVMTLTQSAVFYSNDKEDNPVMKAAIYTLLNKANKSDRAVMDGLLSRTTVSKKDLIKIEEEKKKAKKEDYKKRMEAIERKKKERLEGVTPEKPTVATF